MNDLSKMTRVKYAAYQAGIAFGEAEAAARIERLEKLLGEARSEAIEECAKKVEHMTYKPNPRLGKAMMKRAAQALRTIDKELSNG